MTSPIRVVPLDESFAITGIADYDVEIHVRYRTPDDATETHNYFASIDGMPGYEARGATERGAAEAICGRLIADLTKPPESPGDPSGAVALLASLADRERAQHAERGLLFGGLESTDSIAREEAYRAATHIIRAAKVLAEQPRLGFGESRPPHQLSDAEARASLVASLCKRLPYMAPEVKATYPADVLAEAEAIVAAEAARRL